MNASTSRHIFKIVVVSLTLGAITILITILIAGRQHEHIITLNSLFVYGCLLTALGVVCLFLKTEIIIVEKIELFGKSSVILWI